ncbi:MAG: hypothetical protein LBB88_01805 [Planctomycetaceae bacterium]|nr:hypothetical protein [Planctomycetaceae bacterium]
MSSDQSLKSREEDININKKSEKITDPKINDPKIIDSKIIDPKNQTTKLALNPNHTPEQKNKISTTTPPANSANNGWTAIVPNKIETNNEIINNSNSQEIRVADKKINNITNHSSPNNIGIWDAQPENVTKNIPKSTNTNQPQTQSQTQPLTQTPIPAQSQPNSTDADSQKTNLPFSNPTTPAIPITPVTPTTPTNSDIRDNSTNIDKTQTESTIPELTPKEDSEEELREPPPISSNITPQENKTQDIIDELQEPKKALPQNINENQIKTETNTETEIEIETKINTPNDSTPKQNIEKTPLTNIQALTADDIAQRLNELEKQKVSLEQLLKNKIDENNIDKEQQDSDEPAGVARTRKLSNTESNSTTQEINKEKTNNETITDPKQESNIAENDQTQTDQKNNTEKADNESKTITENNTNSETESNTTTETTTETETEDEDGNNSTTETLIPDFDEEALEEPVKKLINPSRVGDTDGVAKIKLMYDEVINGLKSRNIIGKYERWKEYARTTLRNSAGINTGSELDGRSRLNWYKKLYNEPVYSIFEAEEFTRQLHDGLRGNHRLIAESMAIIRDKLDVSARNDNGIIFPKCETPIDAVSEIKRALISAQMHHARALSTLTSAEQTELVGNLVQTFVGTGCVNGHTIPSRTYGRRLLDMMEKIDKSAMHDAAEAFIPLTNKSLLDLLDQLPENALPSTLIGGQTFQRIVTSAGDIVIGGRGNNAYDLDGPDFRDVICIIDLGGDDNYRDGTCGLHRPVMLIIDLHGNDSYTGTRPGVQAGSILGVSVLIDVEGDDRYNAVDVAQGSSIGGIGLLFDFAGNDSYKGLRRVQAHALSGVGMIIDREGNDDYRAAMWAQAFGAPAGFGVLEDSTGNDHYYCGGLYIDSYPEHPGYDGWGQGIGAGIRQVANGGIGVLLEGAGDDIYEVDYFGHGGGYWLGAGFARDFGGDDIRHGTTLTAYNGTARRENKWTRFANGFGCHYSVGYCFDDEGNDVYGGTIMGTGMAWDLSMGYLCDFNGDNKFTATGGMTQGVGAEGSIGILFTYGGNDSFSGRNQAYANGNINYHSVANCGSNFSFVINYGGTDTYGSGAKNNVYVQRGSTGGFLIDRPTASEAVVELEKLQKAIELRNKEIADYDVKHETLRKEAAAKGRRYYPRAKRPTPIPTEQQRILTGVPDFGKPITTKVTSTDISTKN